MAAELPPDLKRRLDAVQKDLAGAPLPVHWVRADGIHLTLKFLGETAESRRAEVPEALREAAGAAGPFDLEAAGAAAFPERGVPRLIWVEVRGDIEAARRLASAIDRAMSRIGFPPETREFRPHLTLGRVKGPDTGDWRSLLSRAGGRAAGGFRVTEYLLFESRLGPGGAVYVPLERFPLRGGGGAGGAA